MQYVDTWCDAEMYVQLWEQLPDCQVSTYVYVCLYMHMCIMYDYSNYVCIIGMYKY